MDDERGRRVESLRWGLVPGPWQSWLDAELDGSAACDLLAPLRADQLVVRPANPLVNAARHEGRECLVATPGADH